jgi:hypothetical protein
MQIIVCLGKSAETVEALKIKACAVRQVSGKPGKQDPAHLAAAAGS